MPILDASLYQYWISAFDRHDRARKRYEAATATGNGALIDYLRNDLEQAAHEFNQAIRALNNS